MATTQGHQKNSTTFGPKVPEIVDRRVSITQTPLPKAAPETVTPLTHPRWSPIGRIGYSFRRDYEVLFGVVTVLMHIAEVYLKLEKVKTSKVYAISILEPLFCYIFHFNCWSDVSFRWKSTSFVHAQ